LRALAESSLVRLVRSRQPGACHWIVNRRLIPHIVTGQQPTVRRQTGRRVSHVRPFRRWWNRRPKMRHGIINLATMRLVLSALSIGLAGIAILRAANDHPPIAHLHFPGTSPSHL
jgi:hypothetical protein